jgi:two-component system OmpR family response regulator
MQSEAPVMLSYENMSRDVVVLSWPEQAEARDRLDRTSVPRLWLVDAEADPPIATSCIEDWIRLPADDADLRARLVSLAHHAAHHPTRPSLDRHGLLTHRGVVVHLSRVEQLLARPLIADFGEAVSEEQLLGSPYFDDCKEQTLRVHISRLRRRLTPIGLRITSIRGYGYVLSPDHLDVRTESFSAGPRSRVEAVR